MSKRSEPGIVEVFFALSDDTRLSLVSTLSAKALSATSLSDDLPVSRQAVVKYLQVLESAVAGLSREEGTRSRGHFKKGIATYAKAK